MARNEEKIIRAREQYPVIRNKHGNPVEPTKAEIKTARELGIDMPHLGIPDIEAIEEILGLTMDMIVNSDEREKRYQGKPKRKKYSYDDHDYFGRHEQYEQFEDD